MKYTLLAFIILFSSCSINMKIRTVRFIDYSTDEELKVESDLFLKSIPRKVDTMLTIESSVCHSDEEEYIIHIYKCGGITKSKVISDQATYPLNPTIPKFNWDTLFKAKRLIINQKPKIAYSASVIEGDTTWSNSMSSISGNLVWTFTLITNIDTLEWYTTASERFNNPSMEVTKLYEYIMAESYNNIWYQNIYGKRKYKIKPIISRKLND